MLHVAIMIIITSVHILPLCCLSSALTPHS